MNITFKKPARRSMLGTRNRLSILPTNIDLCPSVPFSQSRMVTRSKSHSNEFIEERITRSRTLSSDNSDEKITQSNTNSESFDKKILNDLELLLKKNADSFEALQQERDQLLKIERILKEKLQLETKLSKENKPPNENTPSKLFLVPRDPAKLDNNTEQNSILEEMRSSIKYLKTPRQNRMSRKSIILTPHSMSFCIQKQFEDLLE